MGIDDAASNQVSAQSDDVVCLPDNRSEDKHVQDDSDDDDEEENLEGVEAVKKIKFVCTQKKRVGHFRYTPATADNEYGRTVIIESLVNSDKLDRGCFLPKRDRRSNTAAASFFWTNNLCLDGMVISNEGHGIFIHRAFLSMQSRFFERLFEGSSSHFFYLGSVDTTTLEYAVRMIYTPREQLRSIAIGLRGSGFRDLFHVGHYFQVPSIARELIRIMKEKIDVANCIKLWRLSHNCEGFGELIPVVEAFILKYFEVIYKFTRDFCCLTYRELEHFLKNKKLSVSHESCVLDAIAVWVLRHEPTRCREGKRLVEHHVRPGLLWDFAINLKLTKSDLIKKHPSLEKWTGWREHLDQHLKRDSKGLQKDLMRSDKMRKISRRRMPRNLIFALGGWSNGLPSREFEVYDPDVNRWISRPDLELPMKRAYHGAVVVGSKIFLFGGYDGSFFYNNLHMLDLDKPEKGWVCKASMNHARCYASVVHFQELIWAIGGMDGNVRMKSVEKYDPKKNMWTFAPAMTFPRSDAGATVHNGKIYIAGGYDGSAVRDCIEVFDPETSTWSVFGARLPSPLSGLSLVSFGGKLTVVGGFVNGGRSRIVTRFQEEAQSWEQLPLLQKPRSNCGTVAVGDCLYVVGGYDGWCTCEDMECLDLSQDPVEWHSLESMTSPKSAATVAVLPEGVKARTPIKWKTRKRHEQQGEEVPQPQRPLQVDENSKILRKTSPEQGAAIFQMLNLTPPLFNLRVGQNLCPGPQDNDLWFAV